ncbi:hypothetical protein II906_01670, partial [bacterium]|nr:hypothetical protein [bacterium]
LDKKYFELKNSYTPKLTENKDKFWNIIQRKGEYEQNERSIENKNNILSELSSKLRGDFETLKNNFDLNFDENSISLLNASNLNKIRSYILEINDAAQNKNNSEKNIKTAEEQLEKCNNELNNIKENTDDSYTKYEKLYTSLNEGMKQYDHLSSQIINLDNNNSVFNPFILNVISKLFLTLFIVCLAGSGFLYYYKMHTALSVSILLSVIFLIGFILIKIFTKQDDNTEKQRKIELQSNIIEELKNNVLEYYPQINNLENSYLPVKLREIKSEIENKLGKYDTQNKQKKEIEDSINKFIKEINEADNKIKEIKECINKEGINFNTLKTSEYLKVFDILTEIKKNISEKQIISSEIENLKKTNNEIFTALKNFIIENEIKCDIQEDIKETLNSLKEYSQKNDEIKNELDNITKEKEKISIELKQSETGNINISYENISEDDIKNELLGIPKQKETIYEQINALEGRKAALEEVEELSDLKNKKIAKFEEYRQIVKKIIRGKVILSLTAIAKKNFDKTQPDLISAQKYLSILTDGKYSRINLENQEIENESGTVIKKWDILSRGTKEQLYLALRLGYASNYIQDKSTGKINNNNALPLIIDDAFVNFDNPRTINALKCLLEFAKTNQVLFFTCRQEEYAQKISTLNAAKEINIIKL